MFFRPNIPPKQEGYSRNNDTFLKIEGFWRDKKSPKTLDVMLVFGHGAGGGTRTHTLSPTTDFESVTSANSITPAYLKSPRTNLGKRRDVRRDVEAKSDIRLSKMP